MLIIRKGNQREEIVMAILAILDTFLGIKIG